MSTRRVQLILLAVMGLLLAAIAALLILLRGGATSYPEFDAALTRGATCTTYDCAEQALAGVRQPPPVDAFDAVLRATAAHPVTNLMADPPCHLLAHQVGAQAGATLDGPQLAAATAALDWQYRQTPNDPAMCPAGFVHGAADEFAARHTPQETIALAQTLCAQVPGYGQPIPLQLMDPNRAVFACTHAVGHLLGHAYRDSDAPYLTAAAACADMLTADAAESCLNGVMMVADVPDDITACGQLDAPTSNRCAFHVASKIGLGRDLAGTVDACTAVTGDLRQECQVGAYWAGLFTTYPNVNAMAAGCADAGDAAAACGRAAARFVALATLDADSETLTTLCAAMPADAAAACAEERARRTGRPVTAS